MLEILEYSGVDGRPLRYGKYVNHDPAVAGQALLFIPGMGGSVKGALGFLECLLPQYNVIYGPDLRSFGLNAYAEEEDALTHMRHTLPDLETFHQQVIMPEIRDGRIADLTLCAISLGAVLATLMATSKPERYQRLILLAPAYAPHKRSFSPGYTAKNLLKFAWKGGRAKTAIPYGLEALTRNAALLNDPVFQAHGPLIVSVGLLLGIRVLCFQAMWAVRRLRIPTLMVIPGQDIVCDPATMRKAFTHIPASTTKVCREYADFYHDVLFESEHPEIAADILSWVNDLERKDKKKSELSLSHV